MNGQDSYPLWDYKTSVLRFSLEKCFTFHVVQWINAMYKGNVMNGVYFGTRGFCESSSLSQNIKEKL